MNAITFTPFDDIGTAWNALYLYRMGTEGLALPAEHKAALDTFLQYDAIAATISQTAEYAFAEREGLATVAPGLLTLAASCAFLANRFCIDELGGTRGLAIANALRRDGGEATDPRYPWPAASTDPNPRPEFARLPDGSSPRA